MIIGIFGRPGGGKSYEATRYIILPAILEDKRKVVTNIPIQKDYISKVHGQEYADLIEIVDGAFSKFGDVRPFAHEQDYLQHKDWRNEKGQGVLFVIDEVHLSTGQNASKSLLEFHSMHRHHGFDIYACSQSHRKLHRDFRDMIEISYSCAKLEVLGESGYNRKTFHGLPQGSPASMERRNYDPEYFSYYKSHTASNTAITEDLAKGSKAELNPYKKITIVMIIIGILLAVFTGKKLLTSSAEPVETNQTIEDIKNSNPVETNQNQEIKQNIPVTEQPIPKKDDLTETQLEHVQRQKMSQKYHPFRKVNLHIAGVYEDKNLGHHEVFFYASHNGQKMFEVSFKELLLAGYTINVLGDCTVEIVYYDYRDFITCDIPRVSSSTTQIASN